MADEETLKDLRDDCPCSGLPYCPYEALFHGQPDRLFKQHKCVEILKWNRHLSDGDEGWKKAYTLWFEEGYAGAFAQVYPTGSKLKHRAFFDAVEAELTKSRENYAREVAEKSRKVEALAARSLQGGLEASTVSATAQ